MRNLRSFNLFFPCKMLFSSRCYQDFSYPLIPYFDLEVLGVIFFKFLLLWLDTIVDSINSYVSPNLGSFKPLFFLPYSLFLGHQLHMLDLFISNLFILPIFSHLLCIREFLLIYMQFHRLFPLSLLSDTETTQWIFTRDTVFFFSEVFIWFVFFFSITEIFYHLIHFKCVFYYFIKYI